MKPEYLARGIVIFLVTLAILIPVVGRFYWIGLIGLQTLEIHARMPEKGGWMPENIAARVGEPLSLRLTSDDVIHSFAIGKEEQPAIEIYPGEITEVTLIFQQPGTYVFYCTRWCGPNHWRMRGTIEVSGKSFPSPLEPQPLYLQFGLDIDAPHPAEVVPFYPASPERGANYAIRLPAYLLETITYLTNNPPNSG